MEAELVLCRLVVEVMRCGSSIAPVFSIKLCHYFPPNSKDEVGAHHDVAV